MKRARDLKRDALDAYEAGWRDGCGLPAEPDEPDWTAAEDLVRECHGLGRRTGAETARILNEAGTHRERSAIRRTGTPAAGETPAP